MTRVGRVGTNGDGAWQGLMKSAWRVSSVHFPCKGNLIILFLPGEYSVDSVQAFPMSAHRPQIENLFLTRREMLCRCGMGFGAMGLASLMAQAGLTSRAVAGEAIDAAHPLAPRMPQFPARAKRVIHIFVNGGPSHVDTFDPKPALERYAGKA